MTTQYADHLASITPLSTTLNSLGDGSNKITVTPVSNDGTGEKDLAAKFTLTLAAQAAARVEGATVDLYLLPEVDGVFAYGGDALDPANKHYVGSFEFDAATGARVDHILDVRLPNSDFHTLVQNNTGQPFAATGNSLKVEIDPGYQDVA